MPIHRARLLRRIAVRPSLGQPFAARLFAGGVSVPCVIGPAGFTRRKREGDGATPVGQFAITGGLFRADRRARPATPLALRPVRADDGWCDDPGDARYNRPVRLPCRARCETLWRDDHLYDLVLVIDYNQSRPLKGRGSAIFMHQMAPQGTATAGCVGLKPADLRRLVARLGRGCHIALG